MHSCIQGGATPWLGKTHRQILSALSLQRRKPHDDGRNTGRICSGRASIDKTQPAIEHPRRRAGGNGLIKGLHLYIPTAVELRYCKTKQRFNNMHNFCVQFNKFLPLPGCYSLRSFPANPGIFPRIGFVLWNAGPFLEIDNPDAGDCTHPESTCIRFLRPLRAISLWDLL